MTAMIQRRNLALSIAAGAAILAAGPMVLATPHRSEAAERLQQRISGMSQLHSLLVRKGAETIFAEAPRGPGLDRHAPIMSCSKSLVALLLGIALERGEISSLQARLGDIAPALIPKNATEGVQDLTLEHLVTLQAGLETTSGRNYGRWVSSRNWIAWALRQPEVSEPGEEMIYSTGSTHILGAVLAKATGKSLLAQARERLGKPFGISIPPWTRDPQGYYFGGNGMALTPRAMLDIATAIRDEGRFKGEQILPAAWIRASVKPRTRSPWSGMAYGYGWFLTDSGYILARGYGGQVMAAHPERDLAVVITSDSTSPARSGGYFTDIMNLLNGPVLEL